MSTRGPYETTPLPSEPRNLAERLRWLRKDRGLTQVEVASALGCEQTLISAWEVGRTRPTAVTLGALARHFGVSIAALEAGENFLQEARKVEDALKAPQALEDLTLTLPPAGAGLLMVVDAQTGQQERQDPAEGMSLLLRNLKKGRQAWIVFK